ncbi:MAG: uroporphyrinogen decarboxylase family protein [Candidatus Marinimicrobia bacterium]|jgi:uroporphyrinogen decarboxylase|nr:hypothetical protein [Candidatus Neomarinimicrobiota bacterium]MDP6143396.1 uroporphyrinogen decarboxylase family protein [Candidatus Neomarinimicrobiota bacterium]MDP6261598.1 uroporphyrinogen decarboxylase family protein [Candidatus Neomarinimicrobiota bacterium]MDP7127922.1 uroporphyrinogen decarboxylase family protein [Candidatus Neomarinimicrobiota bacterium]HJN69709.1 uroporphyrinogen decarboxylase family protein [Candidatus Neomarinimicrobiota bacterium]|tara:strand:- start:6498 stop:7625 length:1128 start_codon:yes stop_codon:yes gene_type:complete
MPKMSHRERVMRAYNHEEPDRIPMDLMGNATMLLDKTYLRLRDYLGFDPIPPIRSGTTANYYDERILERFDIDFRRIFLKKNPKARLITHEDETYTDIWGVRYRKVGLYVSAVNSPLQHAQTVEHVKSYNWPKAIDMFTVDGLADEARQMYDETDYALVARNPLSEGFLDRSCQLMGMAEFLMILALKPDLARYLISRLLDIYLDVYGMFLDEVGPYVQMVEVGDDLGTQQNTLISPQMYREFIKPAEAKLYGLIHEKAPNAALFRHCDGAIFDVIPDLIEVGVNVLNPVQTSVKGMGALELKKTYGESITFHGAVEILEGEVPTGTVKAEIKRLIDVFAPGGGYILGSCNHMIDVKPENIVTMFETAREYGRLR